MEAFLWIGVVAIAVMAFAWWAERHWNDVDTYYEREYQDPPITDASGWTGGTRI